MVRRLNLVFRSATFPVEMRRNPHCVAPCDTRAVTLSNVAVVAVVAVMRLHFEPFVN